MVDSWYVKSEGQPKGPFTANQLKKLALQRSISPRTVVRKGAAGRWVQAGRVKGLFPQKAGPASDPTDGAAGTHQTAEASVNEMPAVLSPNRRVVPRLIVIGCLIVFALVGAAGWLPTVFFCASVALLLSSFPRYRINRQELQREFVLLFFPVHIKRWSLRQFEAIETDLEFHLPFWTVIFFGWNWLIVRFLDFIVPWIGGSYIIWLRTWKRSRILAWQGNGEADFKANIETLQQMTGLPIERR